MSLLHKPSVARIEASKADGPKLLQLFESLAADAITSEESALDLAVYYLDPDDEFTVGEFVPELHLVVRKVEPDESGDTDGN